VTIKLHYGLRSPSGFSSLLSPTAGYPVSNTSVTPIRKPWLSSVAANGVNDDWIEHDFGSSSSIAAVCLQSVLLASGTVKTGASTPPATTYGTIGPTTVATDRHGIRKGSFATAITARYVRLDLTNAVDARAAGVYAAYSSGLMEVGAMYVFASTLVLPKQALIGPSVEYMYPEGKENLPNGQFLKFARGAPRARVRLDFLPAATDDIEQAARFAKDALCWLDLGVANRPELQWPVRFLEAEHNRALYPQTRDRVSLVFDEVT